MNGLIFNIQKYSIHDGPGIRTTVFLKGCPLSCSWCHNPESQGFAKETMVFPQRCIGCKACIKVCGADALEIREGKLLKSQVLCTNCGRCAAVCCSDAIEAVGREISAYSLFKELEKDIVFYDSSMGGVTISGGEPLSQPEFTLELLQYCKKSELHTAVDTCGYGSSGALEKISKYTDLFLYDIKLMAAERHKLHTGVTNENILENLKLLSHLGKRIWIRLPLIPGINDDELNLRETAKLIQETKGIEQVYLLPYHNTAMEKYRRLDKEYQLSEVQQPQQEYIDKIAAYYKELGIHAHIGG